MAASSMDSDQMLKRAIRLTHSTHANSAIELRQMLDELIKQRYGAEKMLCNTLTQQHLDAEKNFPGRAATPPPQQETDEIINLTNSPIKTISDSPDTIVDSDDAISGSGLMGGGEDDGNLKEFGDLNCCVCSEMMITATNRLIECSKCGTLYHQECHKPPITNEEASEDHEHSWQCDACFNKPSTSRAAGVVVIPDEPVSLLAKAKSATSSRSSSSSNSSSPFYRPDQASPASTTATASSKHSKSSSSSSTKSHREERSSSSSSKTGSVVSPIINIVSAAEKISSSSSKKHSHSSSKSTTKSKHHESGSKRKAK